MRLLRFDSLKARLTALTLLIVGSTWLAAAAFTWFEARHEAEELFDAHLVQSASLLIAQTAYEIEDEDELEDSHAPALHKYARKVAFQVWANGRLQVHSQNAPSVRLSEVEEGFSDRVIDGEGWRIFSGWNARRKALVQVGERHSAREELAREVAAGLLKPLWIALPVLALLIWLVVRQAVASLEAAARQVARRSPDHLDPLVVRDLPAEARPLVDGLNALFERVARSMAQERRFTADAAHELRTPLAGLRAQAQVAAAATGRPEQARALAAVLEACDRMTRLIEQLLLLARVDAVSGDELPEVDLAGIVQEVMADLAPQAMAGQVDIELAAPGRLPIRGSFSWLSILVRNLVDNAIRYSPRGGQVRVVVDGDARSAVLDVCDDGPGVPADELERLGERFHRVPGDGPSEGLPGSGLGLSIVRRIAGLHGGHVEFSLAEAGRGLRVRVVFRGDATGTRTT